MDELRASLVMVMLMLIFPLTGSGQPRKIIKDYPLPSIEFESRRLPDLEGDSVNTAYRIWLVPDLVIDLTTTVTLTLYSNEYNAADQRQITHVEKFTLDSVDTPEIVKHFSDLQLPHWDDVIQIAKNEQGFAHPVMADEKRVILEYSDASMYRIFSLHEPMFDIKVMDLVNYLNTKIKPDQVRIRYYSELAQNDRKARRTLRSIKQYPLYAKEYIDKKIFPAMWGF
jgi:hypothetical protein